MANYYLTNKAIDDLSAIWNYTFDTWSENQADAYYIFLVNGCREIAENPSLGKKYNEISQGLLGYKVGRHILFYQVISKTEVEIIRILHEQMDLKNRIKD